MLTILFAIALAVSGSREVAGSEAPEWHAQQPDPSKPYAGYPRVENTVHTRLYLATPDRGTYDHAAMIGILDGMLVASWKNGVVSEDKPGQRVLYAQSMDLGKTWTPGENGTAILFPNISLPSFEVHLFAEPFITLNGHLYATASPIQFCLFPVPDIMFGSMLVRRVYTNETGLLGPMFWAAPTIPNGYGPTSTLHNIKTVFEMDAETIADMKLLNDSSQLPCEVGKETLKCEACMNGCQSWADGPLTGNERTHFNEPYSNTDFILYRTRENHFDYARRDSVSSDWEKPGVTDIPDADANLNAGRLVDGRAYLLSNSNPKARDPLSIVTTNGTHFDKVWAVVSCVDLEPNRGNGNTDPCEMAYAGSAKGDHAVAYPQGITLLADQSFVAIYSNNKEDIWVTKFPLNAIQ